QYIYKKYKKKSVILPNFITEEEISKYKGDYIVREQIKNVFYVGRVSHLKGISIIESLASVFPMINFHLIGPVEENIKMESKHKNIFLLGEKTKQEILNILKEKSDLFLFPSHTEGFPKAI